MISRLSALLLVPLLIAIPTNSRYVYSGGSSVVVGGSSNVVTINGKRVYGNTDCITPSATMTEKQIDVPATVNDIDISGMGKLNIEYGETPGLRIKAPENVMNCLEQSLTDNKLSLSWRNNGCFIGDPRIEYYLVLAQAAKKINASGSTKVNVAETKAPDVTLRTHGSSTINVASLTADSLKAAMSGSGNISIEQGTATKHFVDCTGSAKYNAQNLYAQVCAVNLSGSAKAKVHCAQQISGHRSGSSRLEVHGKPAKINVSKSGSSSFKQY